MKGDGAKMGAGLRRALSALATSRAALYGLAVLCLFLVLVGLLLRSPGNGEGDMVPGFFRVAPRDLVLTVMERGSVRPARVAAVRSGISSNLAKIVWLQDEGRETRAGEAIARFDAKPFQDQLQKDEQLLADARTNMAAAEKSLQLQKEDEERKHEDVQRKLVIARIKADDLRHGTGPLKRQQLDKKRQQAERTLAVAVHELEDFEVLLSKGHISRRERDKTADAKKAADEAVQLARAELDNFDRYEWPRLLREAEVIVQEAENEQERIQRTAALELAKRMALVEKFRRESEDAERKVTAARKDLASCEVLAPIGGLLLHGELPQPGGRRRIQIGDTVWVGQTFMEIPDTSDLVAEIQVREIDVAKISRNMPAQIVLDAFPGRVFTGEVESVNALGRGEEDNKNVRSFLARVRFQQAAPEIHVGMSATVTITWRELPGVLAVPQTAVLRGGEGAAVMLLRGGAPRRQAVSLGECGPDWVQILDGLRPGDVVQTRPGI